MSSGASSIYLDYAAATPLDSDVLAAMQPYFSETFYNPSATYSGARTVHSAVEAARGQVAHWLGARPSEIIFTAGGTEANNLAIHGVMCQYPKANMVVSAIEHESVLAPAEQYAHRLAPVDTQGHLDVKALAGLIDDATVLVSVMYANNEVGTIQPLREVSQLLAEIRRSRRKSGNNWPIFLHTDACQAANYLDMHAARLGIDLMTINGGKIYGPKQSGVLYVKTGITLAPQILGGGQERNLRSGTENVPAMIGLSAALDRAQTERRTETERLQNLQRHFFERLSAELPLAIINGSRKHRLPNNVHLTLPGFDNERLLMELDKAGILAAAGSACSASNETPSHVLRAMGLDDSAARASLRLTMGRQTDQAAIDRTIDCLRELTAK